jgi:HEPN domain-containing protein
MNASETSEAGLEWWRYAQDDVAAARTLHDADPSLTRAVCLHAQQGAEKGIKAALVFLQIDFPRTHDLKRLARLLPQEWTLPPEVQEDLDWLTTWATASRYPDAAADATRGDAIRALDRAQDVLEAIRGNLVEKTYLP